MVKSKRDLKSPRRKEPLTGLNRPAIGRVIRPTSATTSTAAPIVRGNIKVLVRVRPPNKKETGENSKIVVKIVDEQMLIFDPKEEENLFFFRGVHQKTRDFLRKSNKNLQFVFDKVFGFDVSNDFVYQNSTYSLVNTLMDGFNCSVFAYGATGAGKTFTMIGTNDSPGITYLTMAELFKKMEELGTERDFEIGITYLEVYNELVQDLLNPGSPLHLREDSKFGVTVAGIKLVKIQNAGELFSLLEQGNKNRTQHPTDANAESSRSHAVFQVYLQMNIRATGEVRHAKLSMIDLAGSERASATGCAGARFTEGANINKSLLALGNCINSLADGHKHIPYRDSKLTRLLKDSLGGNCQTVMIANVSPSTLSYEDTYNTLKYATRAKKITSNIKRNVVNVEMHVGQYVKMVDDLKKENSMLKKQQQDKDNEMAELRKEVEELRKQLQDNKSVTSLVNDTHSVDPQALQQLQALFAQKRALLEKKFAVESSEIGMKLRRLAKENAAKGMENLVVNSPENLNAAQKRIENVLIRYSKKETALHDEIKNFEQDRTDIDEKIDKLLKDHSKLDHFAELEQEKLNSFEMYNKLELEKKHNDLISDENAFKCDVLEKSMLLLQKLHNQARGHGFASESLTKEYTDLMSFYQGKRNIKWGDVGDSGLSSTTSLETVDSECQLTNNVILEKTFSMDNTFTVKAKPKLRAENVLGKANKSPVKRVAKRCGLSPRSGDTKVFKRPPLVPVTSSSRGVLNSGTKNIKPKPTGRPIFRS